MPDSTDNDITHPVTTSLTKPLLPAETLPALPTPKERPWRWPLMATAVTLLLALAALAIFYFFIFLPAQESLLSTLTTNDSPPLSEPSEPNPSAIEAPPRLTTIALSPEDMSRQIHAGDSISFTISLYDQDGQIFNMPTELEVATNLGQLQAASNSSTFVMIPVRGGQAKVTFMATTRGPATIVARAVDPPSAANGVLVFEVAPRPTLNFNLTLDPAEPQPGDTVYLLVSAQMSDGSPVPDNTPVTLNVESGALSIEYTPSLSLVDGRAQAPVTLPSDVVTETQVVFTVSTEDNDDQELRQVSFVLRPLMVQCETNELNYRFSQSGRFFKSGSDMNQADALLEAPAGTGVHSSEIVNLNATRSEVILFLWLPTEHIMENKLTNVADVSSRVLSDRNDLEAGHVETTFTANAESYPITPICEQNGETLVSIGGLVQPSIIEQSLVGE